VSNRTLDRLLCEEHVRDESACCECGYHRLGAHHPKIRCPRTGRCGECGNDWPCREHAPPRSRGPGRSIDPAIFRRGR
jgi:hypothetical protein